MFTSTINREYMTPPAVARLLGKRDEWVHGEIRAGRLPAFDLSAPGANRPTYHIRRTDLDTYLESRSVVPRPSKPTESRSRLPKPTREYV